MTSLRTELVEASPACCGRPRIAPRRVAVPRADGVLADGPGSLHKLPLPVDWPPWPPRAPWPAASRGVQERWRRAARGRKAVVLTALLLAATGLGAVGRALWIPAKAVLAQVLLERAWVAARHGVGLNGGERPRPWPWADTWPVARLTLPGGEPLIVLAGASGRTLAFAPGHMDGSALPGQPGNVVIAGHRDTHFRALEGLAAGDEIRLEAPDGQARSYRVSGTEVVRYDDPAALAGDGGDRLTLVTCWPFEALHPGGPLRYVVTAEAVAATSPAG